MALPWPIDLRVWLYRRDLLAAAGIAPPTTLAELRAAANTAWPHPATPVARITCSA